LEVPDVPRLLLLEPDFLGFQIMAGHGPRRGATVNPAALRIVRDLIPSDSRSASKHDDAAPADDRLPVPSGYVSGQGNQTARSDKIFVRDFVLPVRIGAYARERDTPQRVRFNVEVEVTRPVHVAKDMRDIVSYDIVIDAIRITAAREDVRLVETLAERVAELVLAHERAVRVTVRAEKLDLIGGSVGVEITRERRDFVADADHVPPAVAADPKATE
jgi:dihydroneopterin aldolase